MNWLLTAGGRQHYLDGPLRHHHDNVPNLREIAHSLAQINHFTGHASRPYSVAEHSLLVADLARHNNATPAAQLAALMHDAHECITGDVASPVKQVLGEVWQRFEDEHQTRLLTSYHLLEVFEDARQLIKVCDLVALATERRDLMPFDHLRHDPWPVIDTDGHQKAPSDRVDLASQYRAGRSWHYWAREFEFMAARLQYHVANGAPA
jgi:hypothetical protein